MKLIGIVLLLLGFFSYFLSAKAYDKGDWQFTLIYFGLAAILTTASLYPICKDKTPQPKQEDPKQYLDD